MLSLVEYKHEHLLQITPQLIQENEKPSVSPTAAVTIMDYDEPWAIFGAFFFSPGILHVWALISDHVRNKPIEFHRACVKLLRMYEEQHRPRRIQAEVRVDFERGQRWLEALGFDKEGLMRRFGTDGCDHYLYSRIPAWPQ